MESDCLLMSRQVVLYIDNNVHVISGIKTTWSAKVKLDITNVSKETALFTLVLHQTVKSEKIV